MCSQFLLKNAAALSYAPAGVAACDLRIAEGEIAAVGPKLRQVRGDEVIDLSGCVVMPGLVNAHTHLYSALSRGMPAPTPAPKNFVDILKYIWWNLDECLDDETVYYSALAGAIEAAKLGTTVIVDHHASPNAIPGSLDLIKDALAKVGVRGILCYETTDRGGMKKRDLGLQENERFVTENANNPHFRGTFGAHASFTLGNDSLRQLGDLASIYDAGIHIHVAEDRADVRDAEKKYHRSIFDRFEEFGILRRKSIFAHGVHATRRQLEQARRSGVWLTHQPRSNMNNRVGHAPLSWFGPKAALGTDGFPSDMFDESKIGFFRAMESVHAGAAFRIPQLVQNGNGLVSEFFGRPFGTLKPGSPSDLVVLDYNPSTPITKHNATGHFLFGMNSASVRHVMTDGTWIIWNRQMMTVDEEAIMIRARSAAKKLWKRMAK